MLKKSLAEFGDLGGFTWNVRTKRLVGGHQRKKVFPDTSEIWMEEKMSQPTRTGTMGYGYVVHDGEKYACRFVDWGEEKEKAANIAANQHGGEFDLPALSTWLLELDAINLDMDLTGFSAKEIEDICAPFRTMPDEGEDEVPEAPKVAASKRGELYLLGGTHRVLCDDSTDRAAVERLMAGERADMVFTDPPYNIAEETENFAKDIRPKSYGKLDNSRWDYGFDFDLLAPRIEEILENGTVYITTSQFVAPKILNWLIGWADFKNYCVWNKTNPMPSLMKRHWTWSSELVCYGTKGKHVFHFPTEGHAKSVWDFPAQMSEREHPTQKPVQIPEHAILHSSNRDHLVADLFLGSGSTLIACEKTGRKCFGMEIAPEYIDVILDRFIKFTGKKVYRLNSDGSQTDWADIKTERGEG